MDKLEDRACEHGHRKKEFCPMCAFKISGEEYVGVLGKQAKELNLDAFRSLTPELVWVKKSALDLAKEAIKRKESIEPRIGRAKND